VPGSYPAKAGGGGGVETTSTKPLSNRSGRSFRKASRNAMVIGGSAAGNSVTTEPVVPSVTT
jgi:hypothetical protein